MRDLIGPSLSLRVLLGKVPGMKDLLLLIRRRLAGLATLLEINHFFVAFGGWVLQPSFYSLGSLTLFDQPKTKKGKTVQMKAKTLLCALALVGLTSIPCQAASVETPGFLKYECWFPPLRDANLVGIDVTLLDLDLNYPNLPDLTSYTAGFNSRGVFPDDSHEEYGARMTGWITPTVTGDYDFYLASDDA